MSPPLLTKARVSDAAAHMAATPAHDEVVAQREDLRGGFVITIDPDDADDDDLDDDDFGDDAGGDEEAGGVTSATAKTARVAAALAFYQRETLLWLAERLDAPPAATEPATASSMNACHQRDHQLRPVLARHSPPHSDCSAETPPRVTSQASAPKARRASGAYLRTCSLVGSLIEGAIWCLWGLGVGGKGGRERARARR